MSNNILDPSVVKAVLDYDPSIGIMIWRDTPCHRNARAGSEAGCIIRSYDRLRVYRFVTITINRQKYKRSRLAFVWMTGEWPEHQIDHINGNSLDDRWCNLREATALQNAWNHKRRAKSSSLPMGIRTNPSGRYSARLQVNKKMIQIGTFDTIKEAENAYATARKKYYGEFA